MRLKFIDLFITSCEVFLHVASNNGARLTIRDVNRPIDFTAAMVILHSFNKQLNRNCVLLKYVLVNQVS